MSAPDPRELVKVARQLERTLARRRRQLVVLDDLDTQIRTLRLQLKTWTETQPADVLREARAVVDQLTASSDPDDAPR